MENKYKNFMNNELDKFNKMIKEGMDDLLEGRYVNENKKEKFANKLLEIIEIDVLKKADDKIEKIRSKLVVQAREHNELKSEMKGMRYVIENINKK